MLRKGKVGFYEKSERKGIKINPEIDNWGFRTFCWFRICYPFYNIIGTWWFWWSVIWRRQFYSRDKMYSCGYKLLKYNKMYQLYIQWKIGHFEKIEIVCFSWPIQKLFVADCLHILCFFTVFFLIYSSKLMENTVSGVRRNLLLFLVNVESIIFLGIFWILAVVKD